MGDQEHLDRKNKPEFKEKMGKLNTKTDTADDHFFNRPITLRELGGALKAKSETAPGEDALTYNILKNLPTEGQKSIVQLFNQIWDTGDIPLILKTAIVI